MGVEFRMVVVGDVVQTHVQVKPSSVKLNLGCVKVGVEFWL